MKNFISVMLVIVSWVFSASSFAEDSSDEGAVRFGVGIMETQSDHFLTSDTEYKVIELGYDFNKVVGITADYAKAESNDFFFYDSPDRFTFDVELGYEFGDNFRIKPYASGGLVHIKGGSILGDKPDPNTWGKVGLGLRASLYMFYVNAAFDYFPENDSNSLGQNATDGDLIWALPQHETLSLVVGLTF